MLSINLTIVCLIYNVIKRIVRNMRRRMGSWYSVITIGSRKYKHCLEPLDSTTKALGLSLSMRGRKKEKNETRRWEKSKERKENRKDKRKEF